jgi:glycosyltransferase involved in cell wall biosynthesis
VARAAAPGDRRKSIVKVCFLCVEIFAWGKFGGFGRSTRVIGRELAKRGVEVSAIVPLRAGQKPVEMLDGIRVLGFPARKPFSMTRLIRECDADIYHSQHPSFATWLARRTMPDRRHVVTFRDPKEFEDWWLELTNPSQSKAQVLLNWLYEDSPLVRSAIRRADGLYSAAPSVNEKLRRKYGFAKDPGLLATAVGLNWNVAKADTPTVCFIGRLDRRKRPQLFFELARQFPDVRFLAAGRSNDAAWDAELRSRYGGTPNLELLGFVDQFESARLQSILSQSWILVNTSVREGLPTSFLEALANRCALLSSVDPGGVTQRFGYHVRDDNFAKGLATLLHDDAWRERGAAGWEYVRDSFEIEAVIDRHLQVYQQVTAPGTRAGMKAVALP